MWHNYEFSLKIAIGDKQILCRSGFYRENLKCICPLDEILMKRNNQNDFFLIIALEKMRLIKRFNICQSKKIIISMIDRK